MYILSRLGVGVASTESYCEQGAQIDRVNEETRDAFRYRVVALVVFVEVASGPHQSVQSFTRLLPERTSLAYTFKPVCSVALCLPVIVL